MRSTGSFVKFLNRHSTFFIFLGIFLVHTTFLFNGFVWLDHRDIEQGASILPLHLIFPHAFLQPYADTYFYRPAITILNSLDFSLYHSFAPGYHLTNLLLFLGIVTAAPFFIKSFFPITKKQSLLIMLLIGIHPLTWLPVGAVSYRPELLMTLSTLLCVHYYAKSRTSSPGDTRKRSVSLAVLFGLIAVFAKETTLFLLPTLIFFWEFVKWRKYTIKAALPIALPLFGVLLLYAGLRLSATPKLWEANNYLLTNNEAIATRLYVITKLTLDLFNPLLPRLDDAVRIITLSNPLVLVALGSFLILCLFIRRLIPRSPLTICLFLTLASLIPSLNLIHLPRFYSPHYAFFSVIPFSLLIVLLFEKIPGRYRFIPLFLWMLLAGLQTILGGTRFANDYTLFAPEVRTSPLYKEGNLYLGNYYALQQQFPDAEKAYKTSLLSTSGVIAYAQPLPVLLNLTTVLLQEKKYAEAERYIGMLENKAPASYREEIRVRKAYLLSAQKKHDAVIKLLAPFLRSLSLEGLTMLANAYHSVGNQTKALETLRATLPFLPADKRSQMEKFISSQTQD